MHHFSCNATDQGSVTRTEGLRPGECFSVHHVTFCWPVAKGLRFMSRTQFLSIL